MKKEIQALPLMTLEPSLSAVIEQLEKEKTALSEELGAMIAMYWDTVPCKRMMNREQDLFTALYVLRELQEKVQHPASSDNAN